MWKQLLEIHSREWGQEGVKKSKGCGARDLMAAGERETVVKSEALLQM